MKQGPKEIALRVERQRTLDAQLRESALRDAIRGAIACLDQHADPFDQYSKTRALLVSALEEKPGRRL